jgi:hypothetical protein
LAAIFVYDAGDIICMAKEKDHDVVVLWPSVVVL